MNNFPMLYSCRISRQIDTKIGVVKEPIDTLSGKKRVYLDIERALRNSLPVLIFFIVLSLNLTNLSAQEIPGTRQSSSDHTIIDHAPISEFTYGENLEIVAVVEEEIEWLGFFYRTQGIESFQVRKMDRLSGSSYSYVLDTSTLISAKFEYYLAAQSKEKMIYCPEQAPQELFEAVGKTEEPLPPIPVEREPPPKEEEKKFKLPISVRVNGSIGHKIREEPALAGEEKTIADGNIRLFKLYQKRNFQLDFNSNLSYSSHPLEGDENLNLTDLTLSLSRKNHHLRIGDVSINESKFTISGLGRRGLEYIFDNEKLFFHAFDISSQQEKGWGGFIPKPDLSFYE